VFYRHIGSPEPCAFLRNKGSTLEKTIRLKAQAAPVRHARTNRRNGTFTAHFNGITTLRSHPSTESAIAELAEKIGTRCELQSTFVNVIRVREHVGVFSFDLHGYIMAQHAWPDGHVSLTHGGKCMVEAEDSFRMHVAQVTWDGTLPKHCDILPATKLEEFQHWAAWQLACRHATNTLNMEHTAAHLWASDHMKEFCVLESVSA
jgi:hypothetical protein